MIPRLLACALLVTTPLAAAVQLASPFGDHMVLQQERPVPIWGTATPGEKVTVEFAGRKKSAVAGADGHWRIDLKKMDASAESRTLTVTGGDSGVPLVVSDVLVGEVWLCGGQSNMERQLGLRSGQKPIVNWEQEVAAADHPLIRQLYVKQTRGTSPQAGVTARWTVCSPATVADFTAVGYFFARDLHAARGVPVGIIHSSWGGTPAEAWTSEEGLKPFPEFAGQLDALRQRAANPTEAQRVYAEKLSAWYRANDPGSGAAPWSVPDLDDAAWESMNLPTPWEEAGHPGFDGIAWFRKSFDLPAGWSGRDLELRLGAIDDHDTTWVNGVVVGATSGWITPRIYRVPAPALHPAGNVIAVRVLDTGGDGGIWDKELPLEIALVDGHEASVSLAGPWRARFGPALEPTNRPPTDIGQNVSMPTILFNGMIAPLAPYAIRGVAFYQGEANASRATQYRTLFPAMIADWRRLWGEGDFPFLFVQIAPFEEQPPEIREAQLIAWRKTKNTAMAVTIDVGDAGDIHPANKAPVGARLALAARSLAYGETLEYSGPVFARAKFKDDRAILSFTHVRDGLMAKDGPLTGFTVAGSDGVFHPAQAAIAGDKVVVTSPEVTKPVAVRYGWANVASGNLFNRDGLPASPFRTDVE
jgi:sialate O-acetylesterase